MQFHEFLKYGAIGLSALLSILIFFLLRKQHSLQMQMNINRSVNRGFTKMVYSFAAMCLFLAVLGYGSELTHDYLTKKDLGKELALATEKLEKLTDRVVVAEKDAAVYKAMLDMIKDQTIKTKNIMSFQGGSPSPSPPTKGIPPKIPCPIPEPRQIPAYSADALFKFNTDRILNGKKPFTEEEYKKEIKDVQKEQDEWRKKVNIWLKDHPDQKSYYWFAK